MSSKSMRRSPLVRSYAVERALHQIGRQWRRAAFGLDRLEVAGGVDQTVLRPLDLAGELAPRQEAVGARQPVRDRVQHLAPSCSRCRAARRPVNRGHSEPSCRSADAWNVRASTPSTPSRARRAFSSPAAFSVNVTASTDAGRERADEHLLGDAMRDRRGLAGAGAGQDRDRPSHRLDRLALSVVQPGERVGACGHGATLPAVPDSSSVPTVSDTYAGRRYRKA